MGRIRSFSLIFVLLTFLSLVFLKPLAWGASLPPEAEKLANVCFKDISKQPGLIALIDQEDACRKLKSTIVKSNKLNNLQKFVLLVPIEGQVSDIRVEFLNRMSGSVLYPDSVIIPAVITFKQLTDKKPLDLLLKGIKNVKDMKLKKDLCEASFKIVKAGIMYDLMLLEYMKSLDEAVCLKNYFAWENVCSSLYPRAMKADEVKKDFESLFKTLNKFFKGKSLTCKEVREVYDYFNTIHDDVALSTVLNRYSKCFSEEVVKYMLAVSYYRHGKGYMVRPNLLKRINPGTEIKGKKLCSFAENLEKLRKDASPFFLKSIREASDLLQLCKKKGDAKCILGAAQIGIFACKDYISLYTYLVNKKDKENVTKSLDYVYQHLKDFVVSVLEVKDKLNGKQRHVASDLVKQALRYTSTEVYDGYFFSPVTAKKNFVFDFKKSPCLKDYIPLFTVVTSELEQKWLGALKDRLGFSRPPAIPASANKSSGAFGLEPKYRKLWKLLRPHMPEKINCRYASVNGAVTYDCGFLTVRTMEGSKNFSISANFKLSINRQIALLAKKRGVMVSPSMDFTPAFIRFIIQKVVPPYYWQGWRYNKYYDKVAIVGTALNDMILNADIKALNSLIEAFVKEKF